MMTAGAVAALALMVGLAACSTGTAPLAASAGPPGGSSAARNSLGGRLIFWQAGPFVLLDHGVQHAVTPSRTYCCVLRISPDHHRVLVMPGTDETGAVAGGTAELDGTHFTRLKSPDPTLNLVPQAWSPDGTRIAFEGWDDSNPSRTGAYTAHVGDGTSLIRVTIRPGPHHDIPLDYSPDGTRLVIYRSVGTDPDPYIGGSLWVAGVDGSHPHRIAAAGDRPASWARWSRDGRQILYANERTAPAGAVWTVRSDGTHRNRLFVDASGRFPIQPIWSPDGSQVLFALDEGKDQFTHPANSFVVVDASGAGKRREVIAPGPFKSQPEWWN
jgi:Tol biopolymer transport system component